jgi:hypothetical protein
MLVNIYIYIYHTFFSKNTINVKTLNFILTQKRNIFFLIFVYIGVVYNEKKYKKKIAKRKSKFQLLQHRYCSFFNGQDGAVIIFYNTYAKSYKIKQKFSLNI